MKTRNITCTVCPMSCKITVQLEDQKIIDIDGNTCPKGAEYARTEVIAPVRTLTSSVRVLDGDKAMLSVRSKGRIPKDKIYECMDLIHKTSLQAPVNLGDVIIENLAGTGIDLIATAEVSLSGTEK